MLVREGKMGFQDGDDQGWAWPGRGLFEPGGQVCIGFGGDGPGQFLFVPEKPVNRCGIIDQAGDFPHRDFGIPMFGEDAESRVKNVSLR